MFHNETWAPPMGGFNSPQKQRALSGARHPFERSPKARLVATQMDAGQLKRINEARSDFILCFSNRTGCVNLILFILFYLFIYFSHQEYCDLQL